jgi:hypothetical protein
MWLVIQITCPELAVNCQVEQREFSCPSGELEPDPYRPDLLSFIGAFWPISLPLFHGTPCSLKPADVSMIVSHRLWGDHSAPVGRRVRCSWHQFRDLRDAESAGAVIYSGLCSTFNECCSKVRLMPRDDAEPSPD